MVTFKKKGVGREGMKKNILKKYFIFSNSKKRKIIILKIIFL